MVVILHNIRSLHNVGSIFRTADAVGAQKLYLCGITPAPLDRFREVPAPLAKVSLGAEKTVPWEKVTTTARCIAMLKKQGFTILALEKDKKAIPYDKYAEQILRQAQDDKGEKKEWIASSTRNDKQGVSLDKIALVLGAEVEGISPALLKKCDTIIEIPMAGTKESLNVSVAFGVAAFALRDRKL
jgi:tRNA G18 (ribose-2'-O)-methylase SpoU